MMMNGMQPSIHESLNHDRTAAREHLSTMLQKERTIYKSCDYLHMPNQGIEITESDRTKLVDWCYGVVDNCELDREVVATAMGLVDRFLSNPGAVAREALRNRVRFQLVAVASLCIAIKVDTKAIHGSKLFAALGQGIYFAEDVAAMELDILGGLSGRIYAPTSVQAAYGILSLTLPHTDLRASTWAFIIDEVRFRCEYAVQDYRFSLQRPSTVALAAILDTLDQVGVQNRQAMFRALAIVVDENFDSPKYLMAERDRLKLLLLNDDVVIKDYSVVSESDSASRSSEDRSRSFPGVELESYGFGDQNESYVSPIIVQSL